MIHVGIDLHHAANREARRRLWRSPSSSRIGQASEKLADGMKNVVFPEGTFPPGGPYVPSRADRRLGLT